MLDCQASQAEQRITRRVDRDERRVVPGQDRREIAIERASGTSYRANLVNAHQVQRPSQRGMIDLHLVHLAAMPNRND